MLKTVVEVFIDMKSPHAYLSVLPSQELARDYCVTVRFRPYCLSYVSLGVTESVGLDRMRRPRDDAADRKARMYYAAAREYARLQGLVIRGPHKLLDSTVANKAMLFAESRSNKAAEFAMALGGAGWCDGWRTYDMECLHNLSATLESIGCPVQGLEEFMAIGGDGDSLLEEARLDAEANGIAGTPHYVVEVGGRRLGLFGREHLALIRHKLHEEGLARGPHVTPEFSHAWRRSRL